MIEFINYSPAKKFVNAHGNFKNQNNKPSIVYHTKL